MKRADDVEPETDVAHDMAEMCRRLTSQRFLSETDRATLRRLDERWRAVQYHQPAPHRSEPKPVPPHMPVITPDRELIERVAHLLLTPKQIGVVQFFDAFRRENGCAPTLNEIAASTGVTRVTAFEHVRALIRKGVLVQPEHFKARSLTWGPSMAPVADVA